MKLPALLGAALLLFGLPIGAAEPAASHDAAFTKDGLIKADVNDLKDTQLLVHPDMPLPPGTNVLWCATLQLAWNKAIDLVGEKLKFTQPSAAADLLNREDFTAQELDPASYVAIADFERNHVEDEIRAALEQTFHGAASPELIPPVPANPRPEDFVAYAYLFKKLAFAHPFSDDVDLSFQGKPVKAFGFKTEELGSAIRDQVTICQYSSADDFIIRIATRSTGDELILAKIPPEATLAETIQSVLIRTARETGRAPAPKDSLSVPKLNFDLRRNFQELEGLALQPSPAAKVKGPLVISEVKQLVRFQLNENGAVLKSEAVMNMVGSAMHEHEIPPHQLIFNAPFLILLKEKNAPQPYFAMWVGNTSLLTPVSHRFW
jgi:hypothetical protein